MYIHGCCMCLCRYLGIAFGLANVWHFVNDAGTKALTEKVAENILDDLVKEHFWIVSPKGSVSSGHELVHISLTPQQCDEKCI